ncbi:MAG: phenylalanine--tRNA ligase subunit beta [Chloroherpetonaceae bacterium]|nr:phenylalanine--tRNA ligase subunit beta [Chloroherpetonaceae bacterium]MDW8438296.1 phenylalanine--tRNA ligase subunit beta [Chloroherpetonaceae bacterium]
MKLSLSWLKRFAPELSSDADDIASRLTSLGIEVEGLERVGGAFTNVVVGKVLECRKHPNADKLSLCKVNVGKANASGEPLSIVCGAPNVAAGQTVAVALAGAELLTKSGERLKIKKSKIRGEVSEGMICAEDELGLSDNHDGILVLSDDLPIGEPLERFIERDVIFEIAITPNRPDWLSHQGVARELVGEANLKRMEAPALNFQPTATRVKIEDPTGCSHYAAVLIEGVAIAPSPAWLQNALKSIGLRPINNVVDVTNYVLHSIGQPLHAFDLDALKERRIVVRSDYAGKFKTLDGKERDVKAGMTMICDAEKPVAIGGVMGGLESEISFQTSNVLLESAHFNPSRIRRTAKTLGVSTDASYRFERGADRGQVRYAAELATKLILELAGGNVIEACEVELEKPKPIEIALNPKRAKALIGADISADAMKTMLEHIGIREVRREGEKKIFAVPSFRVDMSQEADLIEEIARLYGYDNIPPSEKMNAAYPQSLDRLANFDDRLREMMIGLGFREILTNPLLPLGEAQAFSEKLIRTLNPVSEEMDSLRPSLLPSFLKVVAHNLNRGNEDLRLFEIGRVFERDERGDYVRGFRERNKLGLLVTGRRYPASWSLPKDAADFFDLKGAVESLLKKLGCLDKSKFVAYTHNRLRLEIQAVSRFESGDGLKSDGAASGASDSVAGVLEIAPKEILKRYEIEQPVFFAELDVEVLKRSTSLTTRYQEPAKYPAVLRDLAFFVPKRVRASDMLDEILSVDETIQTATIFDVYEPKRETQAGEARRSVAFSLKLVNYERTMTDEEIARVTARVAERISSKFGAELRQA